MHRDDQHRLDPAEHLEQLPVAHRPHAVDRRERDVDAPEIAQLVLRQHVVEMRDVDDAEPLRFDDEHRIAVAPSTGDLDEVGGHVAHADVLDRDIVPREPARRVPAGQHMGDALVHGVGAMGVVRVVHRHDGRQQRRADIVVVVGGDPHPLRRFDGEGRMADEVDAHMVRLDRGDAERGRHVAARRPGHRVAARRRLARRPGPGGERDRGRRDISPEGAHRLPPPVRRAIFAPNGGQCQRQGFDPPGPVRETGPAGAR